MEIVQQIAFLIVLIITVWLLTQRIKFISSNIKMGRGEDRSDQPRLRWRNLLLIAFGQKKMFKRIAPAILHSMIYVGFIIINIEVLEFIIDGLAGTHRIFAHWLNAGNASGVYTVALNIFELLAVLVIISCVAFLIRRNLLNVNRFRGTEMTSWPRFDANLILMFEIILMMAILTMNGADQLLQQRDVAGYTKTQTMYFSSFLAAPLYESLGTTSLIAVERIAWWLHIIGIFAFAVYITYSKHLHIFMAFPNTYYANLSSYGKINAMPEVTREVRMMMGMPDDSADAAKGEIGTLGAKDVDDLSWKSLMDAYACTECGRCTAECPANQTGKLLSPRKIMMDVRDRLEETGWQRKQGRQPGQDGKKLLGDYISKEEILACTTCNACVEACPVMIDPLTIITQIRRYMAMEESTSPQSWNAMFSNIETNFAPWKFPASDRGKWIDEWKANKDTKNT